MKRKHLDLRTVRRLLFYSSFKWASAISLPPSPFLKLLICFIRRFHICFWTIDHTPPLVLKTNKMIAQEEGDNRELSVELFYTATQPMRTAMAMAMAANYSQDMPMSMAEFILEEQKGSDKFLPIEKHWRDRHELLLDHRYQQ